MNSTSPPRSAATPASTPSGLARFAVRWAPWRLVLVVLGIVAAIHAMWALGIWWPASSSDALADIVVGRRPFPPSPLIWGVAAALVVAIALVVASMSSALPPRLVRLCCLGTTLVVVVLALRGIAGEVGSIFNLEASTSTYRILDVVLFSPLCLWSALGIHYRWFSRPSSLSA